MDIKIILHITLSSDHHKRTRSRTKIHREGKGRKGQKEGKGRLGRKEEEVVGKESAEGAV